MFKWADCKKCPPKKHKATSGTLRHSCTIERLQRSNDPGQPTETWSTYKSAACGFKLLGGNENTRDGQQEATARAEFLFRYDAKMTAEMRIKFQGQTWNIEYIGDPNGEGLDMVARAVRLG